MLLGKYRQKIAGRCNQQPTQATGLYATQIRQQHQQLPSGSFSRHVSMQIHTKQQQLFQSALCLRLIQPSGLIQEFQLKGLEKCYEWKREHHHHLVCRRCSAVEEIQLKELELVMPLVQKHLEYKTRFSGIEHALEFFGVCGKCSHPSPR